MEFIEVKVVPTDEMFFDEESYFGIYRCEVIPEHQSLVELTGYNNISIKGKMPRLNLGQEYISKIAKDSKSTYKGNYLLDSIKQEKPITTEQQKEYLGAILTANQVNNIYEVYSNGEDVIDLILKKEFDVKAVRGFGEKMFENLYEKVTNSIELSEILAFISKFGIRYGSLKKLLKQYKNPQIVIELIEKNPYVLSEAKGVGFKTCDEIAKAMNFDMESPYRIESCLKFVLKQETHSGHSWMNFKKLLNTSIDLLSVKKSLIEETLKNGVEGIVHIDEKYTLREIYEAEKYVAMKMIEYKSKSKKLFKDEEIENYLDEYCLENGVELEENQRQFFFDWNENAVLLLVGGGGMGKSWLTKILLGLIDKKRLSTALLSPTGRASKVMTGYSGRPASTIHRFAGVHDNEEKARRKIYEDIIIVDETSMCDIFILQKLFEAIDNQNTRMLFIGDDFQLPSVGVGNFLHDVIHSGVIKVSRLKKTFRQKDGGILNVATDIREGRKFLNPSDDGIVRFGKDALFHLTDSEYMKDGFIHYYKRMVNTYTVDDLVVLSPTKVGKLGTYALNKEIQEIVNPPSVEKKEKEFKDENKTVFRVGDLVMNTVNMYNVELFNPSFKEEIESMNNEEDKPVVDVFNGDTGKIVDILEDDKKIIINFDGNRVAIGFDSALTNLLHGWAITKHKSQGSQYKAIIVIIDRSMKYQLNANLIYTGISRAKEFMVALGQAKTINESIGKFANLDRRSFLQDLLINFNEKYSRIQK